MELFKVKELSNKEILTYNGGGWLGPFAGGYIIKEIISGIYQATQRNCHKDNVCN